MNLWQERVLHVWELLCITKAGENHGARKLDGWREVFAWTEITVRVSGAMAGDPDVTDLHGLAVCHSFKAKARRARLGHVVHAGHQTPCSTRDAEVPLLPGSKFPLEATNLDDFVCVCPIQRVITADVFFHG